MRTFHALFAAPECSHPIAPTRVENARELAAALGVASVPHRAGKRPIGPHRRAVQRDAI